MEQVIAQAKKQFEDILKYVQEEAQNQQINEVEKGIFRSLLELGLTFLRIFLQQKGVGYKGRVHLDKEGNERSYHSKKNKKYLSIFGKISILRACYWTKEKGEIYPLDTELNMPKIEHSYVLQEWGAILGSEEPYKKSAKFLETILGIPLWGSTIETIIQRAGIDAPNFYKERQEPFKKSEKEIFVATADGKGIVMKKGELEKPPPKKKPRKMKKKGERSKKSQAESELKPGKKKMSTVIGAYTISRHKRTAESILSKKKKNDPPRPVNKVVQATLEGKEEAIQRLKAEVEKRDPQREKQSVALVDGEHKLRNLLKTYLPWFTIIIDIFHVMEYLWMGAHIFFKKGSAKAQSWVTDKLTKLLNGKIEEIISELKRDLEAISQSKKKQLLKIITYLENGKEHMRYDKYLVKGYPIGSGVVEGACKNLVKDRMEQSGMQWTINGAEAVLSMRSIQINGMANDYWRYHISKERERLYGSFMESEMSELAA
ncbi:ISKra4 family transposase [Candidatus Neptunochlamydia vexilliferae]|uniref:ISKra4 family transposase n=1 Tax=Candidatus Neptunichlamydia vexilliferae TaxID=1651774 RepID=A0ABS0AX52_9BACT|nr:ISKra4 family transposase [Candidatus Neptunochlamydia vexilliferae]MBF5058545.1 hypothetical protein [Candidatus Neptunochlamydia vexilliferae]